MSIKKWLIIGLSIPLCLVGIVMIAGMIKFNILANLPGYDVDGNRIADPVQTPK